eukprot:960494-Amphidinium_carterae.3
MDSWRSLVSPYLPSPSFPCQSLVTCVPQACEATRVPFIAPQSRQQYSFFVYPLGGQTKTTSLSGSVACMNATLTSPTHTCFTPLSSGNHVAANATTRRNVFNPGVH